MQTGDVHGTELRKTRQDLSEPRPSVGLFPSHTATSTEWERETRRRCGKRTVWPSQGSPDSSLGREGTPVSQIPSVSVPPRPGDLRTEAMLRMQLLRFR